MTPTPTPTSTMYTSPTQLDGTVTGIIFIVIVAVIASSFPLQFHDVYVPGSDTPPDSRCSYVGRRQGGLVSAALCNHRFASRFSVTGGTGCPMPRKPRQPSKPGLRILPVAGRLEAPQLKPARRPRRFRSTRAAFTVCGAPQAANRHRRGCPPERLRWPAGLREDRRDTAATAESTRRSILAVRVDGSR